MELVIKIFKNACLRFGCCMSQAFQAQSGQTQKMVLQLLLYLSNQQHSPFLNFSLILFKNQVA
jgi:hypothetical protein